MMMKFHRNPGSALLIVLALVTLITVVSIALFVLVRSERVTAHMMRESTQADILADLAANVALSRLDAAIEEGREYGATSYTAWASEPGRIHVFAISQATGAISREERPMYSRPASEENHVDLNRPSVAGVYPITGSRPARMRVGWDVVLEDPTQASGRGNRPLGRIAWWIDDESCKININTADGSRKADLYRELGVDETSGSYGFGTPSEISLEALSNGDGGTLSNSVASAIAAYGWDQGFNSAAEVNRVDGVPQQFYEENRFNLTVFGRSPDETIFGEPKIPLLPTISNGTRTLILGPSDDFRNGVPGDLAEVSREIDFIYPTAAQLPNQFDGQAVAVHPLQHPNWLVNNSIGNNSHDMRYLRRIAAAIKGERSDGMQFKWPAFPGTNGGFADKYNARQVDSIALQIYDISIKTVFADLAKNGPTSLPTICYAGILNSGDEPRVVVGLGRTFSFTEVGMKATLSIRGEHEGLEIPGLQLELHLETHFPAGFKGRPLYGGTVRTYYNQFNLGHNTVARKGHVNLLDRLMGTRWQDYTLRISGPDGTHAGFDLSGQSRTQADQDQVKAAEYHPYADKVEEAFAGLADGVGPFSQFSAPFDWSGNIARIPGVYAVSRNYYNQRVYQGKPLEPSADPERALEFSITGGLHLWSETSDGSRYRMWDMVPLPSLRGAGYSTEEMTSPEFIQALQEAVLPVDFKVEFPGIAHYSATVADPWVNKFPADWSQSQAEGMASSLWTGSLNNNRQFYMRYRTAEGGGRVPAGEGLGPFHQMLEEAHGALPLILPQEWDGDNPEYSPGGGGDPLALWLARQDFRYPKQSRFPSVGALNYVRTGMIPDDLSQSVRQQRGVPFRSLNFSASTADSQRVNGVRYPDWAMLDLFFVPFVPQKIGVVGAPLANPPRLLTSGGATQGRLNINNPRIPHPFEDEETPPIRQAPLEALFHGIKISNFYDANHEPVLETVDHQALAQAVQTHLEENGPFMLAGQLAEVEAIDSATFTSSKQSTPASPWSSRTSRSRNDLLRQVVGAATTQSNTFSIWVVAQTFRKAAGNTNFDRFEPGDIVTGEVRRRYVVERMVDPGEDGVPGNAVDVPESSDGLIGTADDPVDANHPKMTYPLPYRWRNLFVENFF